MDLLKRLIPGSKNSSDESVTNDKVAVKPKLRQASFTNPDDLCDHVNQHSIDPVSINTADRFYMVFYYA